MNDDDPTDTVHEAFAAHLFGDTPLGRPVLGTVESINAITRDQIDEHYRAKYGPAHLWWPRPAGWTTRLGGAGPAGVRPVRRGEVEPAPSRRGGEYAQPGRAPAAGLVRV